MKIPFNDLSRIHNPLRIELDNVWKRVVDNHSFILGKEVEKFEDSFAKYCGMEDFMHAAGLGSGMDALELALYFFNIKPSDEVIVPAFTFNATASAVKNIGATPVFV